MIPRKRIFPIDDVLWQDDLALFRSLDGRVPWEQRFGKGQVKVLEFDARTEAGTYLFRWPAGYEPFGEHGHGSNSTELVLAGALVELAPASDQPERVWGPGTFLYLGAGERHGHFQAGPDGCTLLIHTDGPLFASEFVEALMASGKASRFRVDLADRPA